MASDMFYSNPKSFKIHRKSTLASKLRSSISQKLTEFLHNYTDRVLIDYIIVLVCNGKDQYRARDDLQAFLGERTAEFVSWLWGFLAELDDQCNTDNGLTEWKDLPSHNSYKDKKNCRSSCSDKAEYHSDDCLMTEDANVYYQLNTVSDAVSGDSDKLAEGFDHFSYSAFPSSGIYSEKVVTWHSRDERENVSVSPTKILSDEYMEHETPRKAISSIVVGSVEKRVPSEIKKVHSGYCNVLPDELQCTKDDEIGSRSLQPSISGDPCSKEVNIDYISERSYSPRSSSPMPSAKKRPRISVWDRLGKPKPQEDIPIEEKQPDAEDVKVVTNDEQVHNPYRLVSTFSNGKKLPKVMSRIRTRSNLVEKKTLEVGLGEAHNRFVSSNIRRKRQLGEDNDAPKSISDSLVNKSESDILEKETCWRSKKSKPMSGNSGTTSNMITEVLDVKERLRQMEMEMAKLRSKHLEMKKDAKADSSSHFGNKEHQGQDLDSRTVLVTNVHFAASREALSLYFSNCGSVSNVVIVMDKATGRPKGSAYITFSEVESVSKALGLSGTTFLSRTIEVSKKTEATTLASPLGQLPVKPSRVSSSYNNTATPTRPRRLQWRREASGPPVVPSSLTSKENKIATSLRQQ